MEKTLEMEKVKEGYKLTLIGVIPDDWEVKKLGQIGVFQTSSIDKTIKVNEDLVFLTNYMNVYKHETINNKSAQNFQVVSAKQSQIQSCNLKKGDILFTPSSETPYDIGHSSAVFEDLQNTVFSYHLIRFRPKITLDVLYSHYFCNNQTVLCQFTKYATGSTRFTISIKTFSNIIIPIPPLPEQQKIASILSTWDEAISKQKNLVEQTKKRNQGLAQQLLTGKKRLKGFEGEWNNLKFGEVINRITRRNDIENTNVVTISAKRGFVRQDDFFNKQVASETLTNYYLIKKGEFAYNKSYSGGYPMGAFKRLDNFDFGVVTTLYICFSIKNDFDSDFFKQYFEAGQMTHGLTKIAQEGGRAHGLLNIGLTDFLSLKIKVPTLPEQKAISQLIENAELELKLQESQLESLQNEKKGLMQMLLTGEVRVKVN